MFFNVGIELIFQLLNIVFTSGCVGLGFLVGELLMLSN
jgi:hypothetical protein